MYATLTQGGHADRPHFPMSRIERSWTMGAVHADKTGPSMPSMLIIGFTARRNIFTSHLIGEVSRNILGEQFLGTLVTDCDAGYETHTAGPSKSVWPMWHAGPPIGSRWCPPIPWPTRSLRRSSNGSNAATSYCASDSRSLREPWLQNRHVCARSSSS